MRMQLEANRVGSEGRHDSRVPFDRALALLDPLLAGAAVVVEGHDALRRPRQVGDDEVDGRAQALG
jgi:hypothetical protein